MPMYEYECRSCGEIFEELMPMSSTETPPCPACKSEDTDKKVSLIGGLSGGSCGGTSGFT